MSGEEKKCHSNCVQTLHKFTTKYCADSVEWCPIEAYYHVLLIGNYQLTDAENEKQSEYACKATRIGRLYVCNSILESTTTKAFCNQQELDHTGILDIKWFHLSVNGNPSFALVDSVGQLNVYHLDFHSKMAVLSAKADLGIGVLGLSLDWSKQSSNPSIVTSDSSGSLCVWRLLDTGLQSVSQWRGHDFEAWISAYDSWDNNLIYSGGDDCKFKTWDLRMQTGQPVFTSKRHTMGVCSIQGNPQKMHQLATGSYDEQLLIWDTRKMRNPLSELDVGGGIWRIKWEPRRGRFLLTATMYNGFHVIDTAGTLDSKPQIVSHYTEHESLAYGIDWYQGEIIPTSSHNLDPSGGTQMQTSEADDVSADRQDFIVASCSFYDHAVHIWKWTKMTNAASAIVSSKCPDSA